MNVSSVHYKLSEMELFIKKVKSLILGEGKTDKNRRSRGGGGVIGDGCKVGKRHLHAVRKLKKTKLAKRKFPGFGKFLLGSFRLFPTSSPPQVHQNNLLGFFEMSTQTKQK